MHSVQLARVAGAPISWGVCEAPDWGHEIAADRVLSEMRELGLSATELSPTGYLGDDPDQVRDRLARYEMRLIGGFLPFRMHVEGLDLDEAERAIRTLAAAGRTSSCWPRGRSTAATTARWPSTMPSGRR